MEISINILAWWCLFRRIDIHYEW